MNGVSIIIPLYNKERSIVSAIESALGQSSRDCELIVVDDGSSDGSVTALEPFKDRIRVLSQENAGPSAARNAGARLAKFPVLAFLDADDEIHEDFVRSHLAVRSTHPAVELSINSFDVERGGKRERRESLLARAKKPSVSPASSSSAASSRNAPSHDNGPLLLHGFDSQFVVNVHSGGYSVNRSLFERCGGYDEALRCWEITDALTKFSLEAKEIAVLGAFLSTKIEDRDNSQWDMHNRDINQFKIYCANIAARIPSMPDDSRAPYFAEIESLCTRLWRSFALTDLVSTYRNAASLPGADHHFSPPAKVALTARVAGAFLKPAAPDANGKDARTS